MNTIKQIKREARQLFRLCRTNGSLDENRVRRVVQTVLESKRRRCLILVHEFERLVRLEKSERTATVESAVRLSPELQAKVEASLAQMYGFAIQMSFTETPALIGGMRVSIGSDVYDGSVKAGLAALEKNF